MRKDRRPRGESTPSTRAAETETRHQTRENAPGRAAEENLRLL